MDTFLDLPLLFHEKDRALHPLIINRHSRVPSGDQLLFFQSKESDSPFRSRWDTHGGATELPTVNISKANNVAIRDSCMTISWERPN